MSNKPKKSVKYTDTELNTDRAEETANVSVDKDATIKSTNSEANDSNKTVDECNASKSNSKISDNTNKDSDSTKDIPSVSVATKEKFDGAVNSSDTGSIPPTTLNNVDENNEPIIIIGGASEFVFEPEIEDEENDKTEPTIESEEPKAKEKSLRIIEGGGKEIVIDDSSTPYQKLSDTPSCMRNKVKDKKIGDYGTYIAIGFFVVTIIISLFNIKGMRYPLSCLFLSLAALTMGVTTALRLLNNKKCDCATCKTQNKTFLYSAILWFAVFVGAMIAFLVLLLK